MGSNIAADTVTRGRELDINGALERHFARKKVQELAFFCIARQGGRTALEILGRAMIASGIKVYIGQNLTGARSMGTNAMVARFSRQAQPPPGLAVSAPAGLMFMHEALFMPDYGGSSLIAQLKRAEVVLAAETGTLMVCSPRRPGELDYPVDFHGDIATVDAEEIFARRVGLTPAPSGITALGLYAACFPDMIGLEDLSRAVMAHERLSQRARKANVECLEEAAARTVIARGIELKGRMGREEYAELAERLPTSREYSAKEKDISTLWRESLPAHDPAKCLCLECAAACFCPEQAISWQDGQLTIEYDFCKGCGVCAAECAGGAMTMQPAGLVLNTKEKRHV